MIYQNATDIAARGIVKEWLDLRNGSSGSIYPLLHQVQVDLLKMAVSARQRQALTNKPFSLQYCLKPRKMAARSASFCGSKLLLQRS